VKRTASTMLSILALAAALTVVAEYAVVAQSTTPPPATLDGQAAGAISSFLTERVNRGDVPGVVVLVVAPGRVLYHEAFGKMDVAHPE
jgi:hypothetical protein